MAVGIGLNVCNHIPAELSSAAISIRELLPGVTVEEISDPILATLRELDLGTGRLTPAELSRFAQRDWLRGRTIREPVAGTVMGVAEDGGLLVRTATGSEIAFRSGTVEVATVSHSR